MTNVKCQMSNVKWEMSNGKCQCCQYHQYQCQYHKNSCQYHQYQCQYFQNMSVNMNLGYSPPPFAFQNQGCVLLVPSNIKVSYFEILASYVQHISNVYILNLLQIFCKSFSNVLQIFFKCLADLTFFVDYR